MQRHLKAALENARIVASRPEQFVTDPEIFALAWAALKSARGQGVDATRLRAAHLVDGPEPPDAPETARLDRVARRTRAIAAAKGYRTGKDAA